MDNKHEFVYVGRTCTEILTQDTTARKSLPLAAYRGRAAYVLLGEPGAGKTRAFKVEAHEAAGQYIRARDFAIFEPKIESPEEILFIDALDEMPSGDGDGRVPFDRIRSRLYKLGCPKFRLSCREADWLGASGANDLQAVSPDGTITVLHLDPLTDDDVSRILKESGIVDDPEGFIAQADKNGLGELLRNPQTLRFLVQAVRCSESGKWPHSRTEIYELACRELMREINSEHLQAKRNNPISIDLLADAAGYLNAVQILSGSAGFTLDGVAEDPQYVGVDVLANPDKLPLVEALKSNLFQSDESWFRTYIHRSVGEYLGARYLAKLIEHRGLSINRVLALMVGRDGGIVSDLRGLFAWLAVHYISGRANLIERDPLGVVLYGDVRNFSVKDKALLLNALSKEARQYPWFRSEDWASHPFGALAVSGMEQTFQEIMDSPSKSDSQQALLDCVLDALRYGERMPSLVESLHKIVRKPSYWPRIRVKTMTILGNTIPDASPLIVALADDIRSGAVEDRDDEILGHILSDFYPKAIGPGKIFDYLHPPKDRSLIGSYMMFWADDLPKNTKHEDLPFLLDTLVSRKSSIEPVVRDHSFNRMVGGLLVRALTEFGDSISDKRLYDWLGVGLGSHGDEILEREDEQAIRAWFESRVDRYKSLLEYGLGATEERKTGNFDFYRCTARFYDFSPPANICLWYLEKAESEQREDAAHFYFDEALLGLIRKNGKGGLSADDLEFLSPWLERVTRFQDWVMRYTYCELNDWRQQHAQDMRKSASERKYRQHEWMVLFRKHVVEIREGDAHPKILHDLALAHRGLLYEAHGDTPKERLNDFLDSDHGLVEAAYAGFRQALFRKDLPTAAEIVDLGIRGRMHYIRWPCLIGMEELYKEDPNEAMSLGDAILSKLVAFRLTDGTGSDPLWFKTLLSRQPVLFADVYVNYALAMLKAKQDHVHDAHALAYDEEYAALAQLALPRLLEGFPLRAAKKQLESVLVPLLQGALHHLDDTVLQALVDGKLGMRSLDHVQRGYWLCAGLVLAPESYRATLDQYAGKSIVRKGQVAHFFCAGAELRLSNIDRLSDAAIGTVVELLGPTAQPQLRPSGLVTPENERTVLVQSLVRTLGMRPTESACIELKRLVSLPELSSWKSLFQEALHSNRISRRKMSFAHVSAEAVSQTLAQLEPASVGDLTATTLDHLQDIARKIRDGSTNDYRQYWSCSVDNRKLERPKPENDCRDALLSDLSERLGKIRIDAQREGNYADDKRADIRVSYGGSRSFNVPVEIKKDSHDDLWRAIHDQLIARYVRDPGADGYGIYVVFWFGGNQMPPAPDGGRKPRSAQELEERLRHTLAQDERHRIKICVIDCALPDSSSQVTD